MHKNDATPRWYWQILVAATLLTRLPLPRVPSIAFARQSESLWAFPLIGALIGSISLFTAGGAMALGLSAPIAAGLLLGVSMVLSGAMHEDGLADCADGFWGGFTPERRLEIMKDSQIGTYGVLALLIVSGLRWLALTALLTSTPAAIIVAALLSRAVLPMLMATLPQARKNGLSRNVGQPTLTTAFGACSIGLVLALAFTGSSGFGAVLCGALSALLMARLAMRKINGQTGDVLGATQVIVETVVLLWFL